MKIVNDHIITQCMAEGRVRCKQSMLRHVQQQVVLIIHIGSCHQDFRRLQSVRSCHHKRADRLRIAKMDRNAVSIVLALIDSFW